MKKNNLTERERPLYFEQFANIDAPPLARSSHLVGVDCRRVYALLFRFCACCVRSCCVVMTGSSDVAFSRSTCTHHILCCYSSRWRSAGRSSCTSRTGTCRRTSRGLLTKRKVILLGSHYHSTAYQLYN